MSNFIIDEFDTLVDSWEFLKNTEQPIFIYGMGDGALKILKQFEKHNIVCSGFFASDEFVRGHYFEGHLVHKLSDIEKILDDFVVVLAFAAGYSSLIEKIIDISKKHTTLAPDVPVYGQTLFNKAFLKENFDKFLRTYNILYDEKSKQIYKSLINFKITGNINYLLNNWTSVNSSYSEILMLDKNEVYFDLGAYNGDTLKEFYDFTGGEYKKAYAFEPNKRNYKKLCQNASEYKNTCLYNCAVWSIDTELIFSKDAGRQSKLSDKGNVTCARSVDSVVKEEKVIPSYIKLDVEGAEKEALIGAKTTIESFKPKIKCALYHRSEDLFELPLLINEISNDYKFLIRQYPYIPAWEINLYAIK